MPEEINRVLTTQSGPALDPFPRRPATISWLEGRPAEAIHDVGNTMIDTLVATAGHRALGAPARRPGAGLVPPRDPPPPGARRRPALARCAAGLEEVGPRECLSSSPCTRGRGREGRIERPPGSVRLLEPLGYLEFLGLLAGAAGTLTDSGGIQEEATALGVPCFTLQGPDRAARSRSSWGPTPCSAFGPKDSRGPRPDRRQPRAAPGRASAMGRRAAERLVSVLVGAHSDADPLLL